MGVYPNLDTKKAATWTTSWEIMKMKKVISVVLACACVFSFAACGSKSDSSKSDSAKSDEKEKLVMATNAEFPPFEYYDGDEVV